MGREAAAIVIHSERSGALTGLNPLLEQMSLLLSLGVCKYCSIIRMRTLGSFLLSLSDLA